MEKRRELFDQQGRPVLLEWAVDAIVTDDSTAFAERLQDVLNVRHASGFRLTHMLTRTVDNGLVVTFQKVTFLDTEPMPGPGATTGDSDELH